MVVENLLALLNGVRPRGTGRWAAKCPAHADRSPSLSVSQGNKGILLKCWAGCSVKEISEALGISERELFFDAPDANPQRRKAAAQQRDHARQLKAQSAHRQGALIDALREADYFVLSRRGLDISGWSDQKLDDELKALADAYHLLENEDCHG
jgi:hypothetical protein